MTELLVTLLRLSYLVLLWIFVLAAIAVLRRDIYGVKAGARGSSKKGRRKSASPDAPVAVRPTKQGAVAQVPTQLHVTAGRQAGVAIALPNARVSLGRDPGCTLQIDDDYASTVHAFLFPQGPNWYLEDNRSRNGTFLGVDRVTDPVPVKTGEQIRIGQTVLELH